ncbi:hypothetical protein BIV25_15385 [Streptomyces sp. MUSC 14]|nr:hypothetical protein BIV25_15385 [Streptomyces sp. MUSC 14]
MTDDDRATAADATRRSPCSPTQTPDRGPDADHRLLDVRTGIKRADTSRASTISAFTVRPTVIRTARLRTAAFGKES